MELTYYKEKNHQFIHWLLNILAYKNFREEADNVKFNLITKQFQEFMQILLLKTINFISRIKGLNLVVK